MSVLVNVFGVAFDVWSKSDKFDCELTLRRLLVRPCTLLLLMFVIIAAATAVSSPFNLIVTFFFSLNA